jgi:cardiolipin synthase (CMP-forming)
MVARPGGGNKSDASRVTLDKYMPRWFNLANLFTLLRLILVPYVIGAILDGRHGRALELFFVAALTDVIDGTLARSYGLGTEVGAYLDPIADKCLLSGIFLALGATGAVPWWFVAVVFGRDIYILLAVVAVMALTKVRKFPPSRWGKISTFVQIATAVAWLVENIWPVPVLYAISSAMLWVCAGFTLWSGIHYTLRGTQTLRAH